MKAERESRRAPRDHFFGDSEEQKVIGGEPPTVDVLGRLDMWNRVRYVLDGFPVRPK